MKIIDYADQHLSSSTTKSSFIELATATLIFVLPVIMLFLLAK